MLSSENPPPDLPCSPQISPLSPLPNFSIRGYVSGKRAKDIRNNWPFSQKNLQRCLKYGVKDVLPPFEESLNGGRLTVDPNNTMTTETLMAASKVCPVCKTFSSSSNTTLNAHIDQCLSGESTVKWTASTSSKVIKHRIRQRKTRLMVDIYEASLHCTLEDLDRRNGSSWASNLGFPGQDLEACTPVNVNEDINEDGDYLCSDSNKKRVRVLSKLRDLPSSSEGKKIPSLSKKFASLTKKLLSVKHASVSESKKKMRRTNFEFKKRGPRQISGSEVEAVETLGENEAQMGYSTSKSLILNKDNILETQKERGGFVDAGKIGDMPLKSPDPSPESDNHDGAGKNVEIQDEFVSEPTYEVGDGEAFAAFNRSLNSSYFKPIGTNIGECFSTHYNDAYEGHCNNEPMVSEEDISVTQNIPDVAEIDAGDVQRNYYVDVDPIQIPGPPGSFLPSPGRMGSEELQGISSLTTCRIQSSEDEREVIDMGSLDSPISAISVASNSFAPVSKQSHFRQTLPENNPTPEPEKDAMNSSMGYNPSLVVSSNSEGRFTSCSDHNSPAKSTSNPVLRLMGKNLVVVNNDKNPSPPNRLSSHGGVDNGISTRNIHEPQYFHRTLSGHPPVPENMPTQYFDNCNLSNGFHGHSNFRPPPFPSKSFGRSFSSSFESHEYAKRRNLIGNNPLGSNMRLGIQTAAYNDNIQILRNRIQHLNSVDSLGRKLKEIIIVDDSPERAVAVEATHIDRMMNNPFYGYDQTQGYPISAAGSRVIQNRNTRMLFSKGVNGNLDKWNDRTAEGSTANSVASASMLPATAGYLKPSLFFPHNGYS